MRYAFIAAALLSVTAARAQTTNAPPEIQQNPPIIDHSGSTRHFYKNGMFFDGGGPRRDILNDITIDPDTRMYPDTENADSARR